MDRYHFVINDGSPQADRVVADLASVTDARREALRIAAERLFDERGSLRIPPGWHIDVTDVAGKLLFQIQFSTSEGAARSWPAAFG